MVFRPHFEIKLILIFLFDRAYRRHVVRCSNKCFGKTCFMMENPGQSKVTKFDIVVGVQEDIGWFEVSMEYSFPVLSAMAFF